MDDLLATICQMQLFLILIGALILKTGMLQENDSVLTEDVFGTILVGVVFGPFVIVYLCSSSASAETLDFFTRS